MFVKIKKLNYKGEGIGYSSKGVFKLRHVLPGEVVNVETNEIKQHSKFRILPVCKYYYNCNGCNLQISSYEYQIQLKFKFLTSIFRKLNVNPYICEFELSEPLNYLNAYRRSYYNISVDLCPLLYEQINEILKIFPNSLYIRGSKKLNGFIVYVEYERGLDRSYFLDIYNSSDIISGIILKKGRSFKVIAGDFSYKEKIFNKTIRISLFSDFDENVYIFEKKVEFLKNSIRENGFKKALLIRSEYYPAFLFEDLEHIIAIERNGYNFRDLSELVRLYDIFNCEIISVKPSNVIETISNLDLIILNKPLIKHIKSIKDKRFKSVIVILDDLKKISPLIKHMDKVGYKLYIVKPFDSYPQIFKFDTILFFK
ncbi:MAG: hypothetical protein ABIL37_01640 [candidate division WOR-3 bacterium]